MNFLGKRVFVNIINLGRVALVLVRGLALLVVRRLAVVFVVRVADALVLRLTLLLGD